MSISSYTGSTLPDPTVLIIDDHELVATSLAMTLRSAGLQAQRHAVRSREGVLVATATIPPGVALLDLDLGRDPDGTPIDGITLIEGLCRSGWRVLALSGTSDEARIGKALAAGALAGIPKSAALPVLVTAVRRAAQGLEVMHPERRRQLIEAHTAPAGSGPRCSADVWANSASASELSSTGSPEGGGRSRSLRSSSSPSRQCGRRSERSSASSRSARSSRPFRC